MRSIPQCFYDRALIKAIDSHIEDGYKSYSDLDDTDKELIAARCIELMGDDAYECIAESDISSALRCLTRFLRSSKSDDSYDLIQTIVKNTTDYFTNSMNALFDERLGDLYQDKMRDLGMRATVDRVNGETSWRKYA
jgi:hypothetical protein